MVRQGRCRCGMVLTFQHGMSGFKMRCPQCGAVVRLRTEPPHPYPSPIEGERGRGEGPDTEPREPGSDTIELEPYLGNGLDSTAASGKNFWLGLIIGAGLFLSAVALTTLFWMTRKH